MQFYYFVDGERKRPIDAAQLKNLAAAGKIAKETEIELEDGRRIQARKIQGLTFKSETPQDGDAGDIYGVAAPPVLPPEDKEDVGGAASNETPVPPVDVPGFGARALAQISRVGSALQQEKFNASALLFALSAVFLVAALLAALVGCAQLLKTQTKPKNAPSAARLDELEKERSEREAKLREIFLEYPSSDGEADRVARKTKTDWQAAALGDARLRPSASIETYADAFDRLDFSRHKFIGGDAYNYEVNASLFTGLATLGVGTDVRDVRSEVRSASAVIAAGAGFVCAALFASTSALLLAFGLLARRTSAV